METPDLVAGESRETLLRAVLMLRFRRNPSGTCNVGGTLPLDLVDPSLRALHRVEEDLEKVDLAGGPEAIVRTSQQRRADAFGISS